MAAPVEPPFPPLSTSLVQFLDGGSDAELRALIYSLLKMSSLMLRSREYYAAHMGVSGPQYSMLVVIAERGEAKVRDLADALHTSSPFITAEVKKLIRMGYVQKRVNENDRRSTLLSLTGTGREKVVAVSPLRQMANDIVFGSFERAEAQVFARQVEVMLHNLERAIHAMEAPEWRDRRAGGAP